MAAAIGVSSVLLLGMAVGAWVRQAEQAPGPAVTSAVAPRVAASRCADCHQEIVEQFPRAPHARTLQRATSPEMTAAFDGKNFRRPETGVNYRFEARDDRIAMITDAYARDVEFEWVFGSGTHALTPLSTWTDADGGTSAIEQIVSWYADGELGVTLGLDPLTESRGIHAVGRHWGPAEVINCFGCHATHVPTEGERIEFEGIEPGVSCSRCHWDTAAHVRAMEAGEETTIERFSALSARESVDRCGECHRRASEMGGPIREEDRTIVRFAPVGLVQSPCFVRQGEVTLASGEPARLDCTTCHDPHRPAERRWQFHAAICLSCHDEAHGRGTDCTAAARDANCLQCHMPKVAMNEHLAFTDHWIRVRREGEPGDDAGSPGADEELQSGGNVAPPNAP